MYHYMYMLSVQGWIRAEIDLHKFIPDSDVLWRLGWWHRTLQVAYKYILYMYKKYILVYTYIYIYIEIHRRRNGLRVPGDKPLLLGGGGGFLATFGIP